MESKFIVVALFFIYIGFSICVEDLCSQNVEILGDFDPSSCPEGKYYERSNVTNCIPQCVEKIGKQKLTYNKSYSSYVHFVFSLEEIWFYYLSAI